MDDSLVRRLLLVGAIFGAAVGLFAGWLIYS